MLEMIKKQNWIKEPWLFIISIGVILITSIPYVIGYSLESKQFLFSGFIIGVDDGNSYLAKMLLGSSGKWLFTTPYTAYPQNDFFAFFPYIVLGKLASTPEIRLQNALIFHFFRISGIYFLVLESYKFCGLFLSDKRRSYLGTFVLIFGGGFGWLGILFPEVINNRMPLEFYSPETFGFLSAFTLPHLLFGRALLFKSFRSFIDLQQKQIFDKENFLIGGIWLLLSGVFQPLNLVIGYIVSGVYWAFKLISEKKKIVEIIQLFYWIFPSLPLLFYNFFFFLYDPFLSSWQGQNKIPSPPITDYLLAYGFGLIAIGIGYFKKWFKSIKHVEFLLVWILILPILIYSPLNIQRRLSEGVWLCFSIFIVTLIFELRSKVLKTIIILLLSFPSLLFIQGALSTVRNISQPVFIPTSLADVTSTINNHLEVNDVVLAPFFESNVLPSFIPVRVITGHGPESMNLSEIQSQIDNFYNGNLDSDKVESLIETFNIRFIVFPNEIDFKKSKNQLSSFNIIKLYQNDPYIVVGIDE